MSQHYFSALETLLMRSTNARYLLTYLLTRSHIQWRRNKTRDEETSTKCDDTTLQTLMRCRRGRSVAMLLAMISPSRYSSRLAWGADLGATWDCWPPSDIWRLWSVSCSWLYSQSSVRKPTNDFRLRRTGASSNNL